MKKIMLVLAFYISFSFLEANERYPIGIEFNITYSCMKSRGGGLTSFNNQFLFSKLVDQCTCYVSLIEKNYKIDEFIEVESKLINDPKGKEALEFMKFVQTTVTQECF